MAFFLRHSKLMGSIRSAKIARCNSLQLRCLSTSDFLLGRIVPFNLSDIGEGIREVTVKEWFVKPGDTISQFDTVCEVQSDKASVTITSRYDGLVKLLHHKVDGIALVGQPLIDIELADEDGVAETESPPTSASVSDIAANSISTPEVEPSRESLFGKQLTTPAVRRIAMEHKIKLSDVVGTGKDGRILKEDMIAYIRERDSGKSVGEVSPQGEDIDNRVQGKILTPKSYAKHMWTTMTRSLNIPHFVYSDECDVTKLMQFREEVKEAVKKRGVSLTFMPFFIKAVSKALEEIPELNGILDEESKAVNIMPNHNVGIAMDTPDGLVVPIVKNVQNLDVIGIAKELNRLQELGKRASIPLNDLSGGTISLSNIGVIGGTYTKPVILSPQIAIGALGKTQKLPRFDEQGNVVAAQILNISWAADHRVVDGVTMARFSNLWRYYVENPALLAINA